MAISTRRIGNQLTISFPYNARLVRAVKSVPGRRFDPRSKSWTIPLASAPAAAEAFGAKADARLVEIATEVEATALAEAETASADAVVAAERISDEVMSRLFPHQREAVRFALQAPCKGVILADDMGLGKTRTAIVSASALFHDGDHMVVACPASLKFNWEREIGLALGNGQDVQVVSGGRDGVRGATWTVVNYDVLGKHVEALVALAPTVVILDESHYCKEPSSARTKAAAELAEVSKRCFLLSGTPMKNRARELISQLRMIGHPIVADGKTFLHRYCDPQPNKWARCGYTFDGTTHAKELREKIADSVIQRKKGDVLDLPGKLRAWAPVEIDAGIYEDAMEVARAKAAEQELDDEGGGATNALALITQERVATSQAKIGSTIGIVQEILDGSDEKVLVFCAFTAALQQISAAFPGTLTLDGSTPVEQRQALVDRFQSDPDVRVMVLNIVAGGVGLTLTSATQVVMHDLVWTPADHVQAEDRTHRIRQANAVNITYVVGRGTIDEMLSTRLDLKMSAITELEGRQNESILGEMLEDVKSWLKAQRKAIRKTVRSAKKARKAVASAGYTTIETMAVTAGVAVAAAVAIVATVAR